MASSFGNNVQYSIRWDYHRSNQLLMFDRLFQTESLTDVTLACEGASVKCHKIVLAASSPYFNRLFLENDCRHPIVILTGIKFADTQALLEFMYRGEVTVAEEQLPSLLHAAGILQVKGLGIDGEQLTEPFPGPSHQSPAHDSVPPSTTKHEPTSKFPAESFYVKVPGENSHYMTSDGSITNKRSGCDTLPKGRKLAAAPSTKRKAAHYKDYNKNPSMDHNYYKKLVIDGKPGHASRLYNTKPWSQGPSEISPMIQKSVSSNALNGPIWQNDEDLHDKPPCDTSLEDNQGGNASVEGPRYKRYSLLPPLQLQLGLTGVKKSKTDSKAKKRITTVDHALDTPSIENPDPNQEQMEGDDDTPSYLDGATFSMMA